MNFNRETLALAVLTLVTVALVKGPVLGRWELFQQLKTQVHPTTAIAGTTQRKYRMDLVGAKIKLAKKQLEDIQPTIPNQPFEFVKTLQDLSTRQGCVLSNWTEANNSQWQADLTGSAAALTALLYDLESAMPTLQMESTSLQYRQNALRMQLHIRFPDPASDSPESSLKGGSIGAN